jgi:hypothetical protein
MNERKSPFPLMAGPTRRSLIVGVAAAVGGLIASPRVSGDSQAAESKEKIKEPQSKGIEGLLTYLHQEIEIKASRQRIYEALLRDRSSCGRRVFDVWRLDHGKERRARRQSADRSGVASGRLGRGRVYAGQIRADGLGFANKADTRSHRIPGGKFSAFGLRVVSEVLGAAKEVFGVDGFIGGGGAITR